MKILLSLLCLVGLLVTGSRAGDLAPADQLRSADDERVAAMTAADPARLNQVLSDQLRYAHSTGHVDTKASLVHALTSGATKYVSVDYEARDFTVLSPDVALMTGKAMFHVQADGKPLALHLGFLGVWRNEQGHWRFVAWQSCPVPASRPASLGK